MFQFEVFCEKKKLGDCLEALTGLAINVTTPRPVANATAENGKIHALTNGSLLEQFKLHLKKNKVADVLPSEVRAFCVKHGRKESCYSGLLKDARSAGVLKKSKDAGGNKTAYAVQKGSLNA